MPIVRTGPILLEPLGTVLLLGAGKFAASPETLPVFYAWLRAEIPAEIMPSADQIPELMATICSELAAPLAAAVGIVDGARGGEAHEP